MAIELDTSRVAKQSATTIAADSAADGAASAQKMSALLGGKSLTVTDGSFTDLEALVARLKNDQEKAKVSVLLSSLNSIGDSLTEVQKKQIEEGLALSEKLSGLEKDLSGLNAAVESASAESLVLQAQIDALQKQIDLAVEEGKDHNELVAKQKELKGELDAKKQAVDDAKAKINETKNAISAVNAKIDALVESVGENALKTIAQEFAHALEPEKPETNAESEKKERKAEETNIFNSIRDSLGRFEDMLQETIEEKRSHMV